jgi:ribose transport system permease protein
MEDRQMKNKFNFDIAQLSVLITLIIMFIFFSINARNFLGIVNILNILKQVAMYGICAVGMSMVIMTNGVDLSMGTIIGLTSCIAAMLDNSGFNIFTTIAICIIIGALVGLINGINVNEFGMFPMIATMGSQVLFRGVAYIIANGIPIYINNVNSKLSFMGKGLIFGKIPFQIIIMFVLFGIGIFILSKTIYGREIYAVGGNQEAARLSGISYKATRYKAYIIAGVCAAIAGMVYAGRTGSGQPTGGTGFESVIVPACVLGGVRLGGGEGKLQGVLVGVLFMGVLTNGMIMMGINEFWQTFAQGAVLLASIAFDKIMTKRSNERKVKTTTLTENV